MSEKLALAFLSHMASPVSPTGAEQSLALLAEGMHQRGHRVAVVVPGPWALGENLRRAGLHVEIIPSRSCWLAYYEPRPWPVAVLKWARWAWPERSTAKISRFLRAWAPDVVHVNCLPHLRGAAAGAGYPLVWHIREILPPGGRRRWLAGRVARRASRVVAVSDAVGSWLRAEGLGGLVRVIHNGVRTDEAGASRLSARKELGLPEQGVLTGLLGQLLPHKGPLVFISAARRVLKENPEARFLLAGGGPQAFLNRIRAAIDETGSPERFHLLSPRPSGRELIAACDVICLATITPDPLPRVILEAMAAARPVAAFRSGGTPEMIEDGRSGLLAEPGDAEALAAAMSRLIREPALRQEMGSAGLLRVRERFTLERHIDSMESEFLEARGHLARR